jgi:hypothetical protein
MDVREGALDELELDLELELELELGLYENEEIVSA